LSIGGLNRNHDLKNIFKGAATWAAANSGPCKTWTIQAGVRELLEQLSRSRKDPTSVKVSPDKPVLYSIKNNLLVSA
jgi:hypothetical protein